MLMESEAGRPRDFHFTSTEEAYLDKAENATFVPNNNASDFDCCKIRNCSMAFGAVDPLIRFIEKKLHKLL